MGNLRGRRGHHGARPRDGPDPPEEPAGLLSRPRADSTRSSPGPPVRPRLHNATIARGKRLVRPSSLRSSTGPNASGVTSMASEPTGPAPAAASLIGQLDPGRGGHALRAQILGDRERADGVDLAGGAHSGDSPRGPPAGVWMYPKATGKPGMRMSARCTRVPSSSRADDQHHPKAHQSRTPQEWSRCP